MLPGHTLVVPPLTVIVSGCDGILEIVTANVRAVLVPQLLLAVTEIVPLLLPAIAVIELVVDEPPHPEGSVQV